MNKATWKKGEKTITGCWLYSRFHDHFVIQLDGKDDLGISRQPIYVHGDGPDFCGWELVKEGKAEDGQGSLGGS